MNVLTGCRLSCRHGVPGILLWFTLVGCACSFLGQAPSARAALNATGLFPANGAADVCPDTLLRITFDAAPTFTNSGSIRIYTAAGVLVDALDLSLNITRPYATNVQTRIIGGTTYTNYPIIVNGCAATIHPHAGVLSYNQTYFVNLTPGIFTNSAGGAFAGITDANTWRFTTRTAGPVSGTNYLVVAADGSGDFVTVQGAVSFLPATSSPRATVFIRKGVYQEIVNVNSRNNVTFRGEDRRQTVITYANNNNLNSGTGARILFNAVGNDLAVENLTLTNSTPYGGSQAEALRVYGLRFVANHAELDSYQDSLLVNSRGHSAYFYDNRIQGSTDFIWGSGTALFQECEIKVISKGYNCQMRTEATNYGAIFADCSITKASGFTGHYLSRIDPNIYSNSAAAYLNCRMDSHIDPAGWLLDKYTNNVSPTNSLRFWEYQSTDLTGTNLVNTASRAPYSRQLTAAEAADLRNLTNVFGWLPQLAPNITVQPLNQTVIAGSNAIFSVLATGIQTTNPPAPQTASPILPLAWQWRKNGTNLLGATNALFTIPNAQAGDAGTFSVIVSNLAGAIVSSNATLEIHLVNTPPTLAALSNVTINAGVTFILTNTATDPEAPPQVLTFSLLQGPTNATLDAVTGVFTWRPSLAQDAASYPITVMVADNDSPVLSVTQSFLITVNPLSRPQFNSVARSGAQLHLQFGGDFGPDYAVQASTDLVSWVTVFLLTNSPALPLSWTDPNADFFPRRFYRVAIGAPFPELMAAGSLYFVATNGSDSNPGTFSQPFATLGRAASAANPADTIYVCGGTYASTQAVSLSRSGSASFPICVRACPGEHPVFDFSGESFGTKGINVSGNWWQLLDLEVVGAGGSGIEVTGRSNLIARCVVHHNRGTGLSLSQPGSDNLVLNCDSCRNFDYDPGTNSTHGENADGFGAKFGVGPGNVFRGCRSWENADDGWDLWQATNAIVIENCWTFRNGTNFMNDPLFSGDGNGFKLGGNYFPGAHLVRNCVSFNNPFAGFDQNNNLAGQTLDNCTAWANGGRNFSLNHGTNGTPHLLRNNLSIAGGSADAFTSGSLMTNNSWQVLASVSAADLQSTDVSLALLPRADDGSLPPSPFLKPVPGGQLIDRGVDIGQPFSGAAPELGAFEVP
jgi:pectin methylesterase-like acyl-CoA thioesterase